MSKNCLTHGKKDFHFFSARLVFLMAGETGGETSHEAEKKAQQPAVEVGKNPDNMTGEYRAKGASTIAAGQEKADALKDEKIEDINMPITKEWIAKKRDTGSKYNTLTKIDDDIKDALLKAMGKTDKDHGRIVFAKVEGYDYVLAQDTTAKPSEKYFRSEKKI